MRSSLSLSALALLGLLVAPGSAGAVCVPHVPSASDPSLVVCLNNATDNTCRQLGETTMDGDKKNIIACLADDAGTPRWKSMSGGGEGGKGSLCGIAVMSSTSNSTGMNNPAPSGATIEKCQGHNVLNWVQQQQFPYGYAAVVDCPSGYHSNYMAADTSSTTNTSSGELGVNIDQEGTHTYPTYTSTTTTTYYTCVAD